MRINQRNLTQLYLAVPVAPTPPDETAGPSNAGPAAEEASLHVPSAELLHWFALLRKEPELRPEVVELVAKKLAQGKYHTPESARQTAAALLRDLQGGANAA